MHTKAVEPIEKIFYVLELIEHKLALSPKGKPITFSAVEAILKGSPLDPDDFHNILEKLEKDELILTLHSYPRKAIYERKYGRLEKTQASHYSLSITDKFAAYYLKVKTQIEESPKVKPENPGKPFAALPSLPNIQPANTSIKKETEPQVDSTSKQKTLLSIRFDDLNRYILLNDCFLIAQPDYDSENYRFFDYVWKNPDRNIPIEELNQNLEAPLKKPLAKILDNLNFKGSIKDAFFKVSKTSIHFTPSRPTEDLISSGLYPLRLFSTQKLEKD